MKMKTKERILEIEERLNQLRQMGENCCRIIGMYERMNHPNRDKLASVYRNNLESLRREFDALELERKELMPVKG